MACFPAQSPAAAGWHGARRVRHAGSSARAAGDIYTRVTAVGQQVGIAFAFDRIARQPNTVAAHRLIRWAGDESRQDAMVETLFQAYFLEGADLTSTAVLIDLAQRAGLDPQRAQACLTDDGTRAAVLDEDRQARELGVEGVPFFVFNRRWRYRARRSPRCSWVPSSARPAKSPHELKRERKLFPAQSVQLPAQSRALGVEVRVVPPSVTKKSTMADASVAAPAPGAVNPSRLAVAEVPVPLVRDRHRRRGRRRHRRRRSRFLRPARRALRPAKAPGCTSWGAPRWTRTTAKSCGCARRC